MADWNNLRRSYLHLPREPQEKYYQDSFEHKFENGIPYNAPPYWHFFMQRHTIPVHCQQQRVLKNVGESLYLTLEKEDFQILGSSNKDSKPPGYSALSDPNLKKYFKKSGVKKILKRQGLITNHLQVVTSLKDFNHYRRYLYYQLLRKIDLIWREELEVEKNRVKLVRQKYVEVQRDNKKYDLKKDKLDWFKERKRQLERKHEEKRERYHMGLGSENNRIQFRRLQKYNRIVERLSEYFEVLEHRRLMGIYYKDAIRQEHFRSQKNKQANYANIRNKNLKMAEDEKKAEEERRCDKISDAMIQSYYHRKAVGEQFKNQSFGRGLYHYGKMTRKWEKLDNNIKNTLHVNQQTKKAENYMFKKWWEIKSSRNKNIPTNKPKTENFDSCWDVLGCIEDLENLGKQGTGSIKENYLNQDLMQDEDFTINQLTRRMVKRVLERSLKWIGGEITDFESTPFNLIQRSELDQHRTIPEMVNLLVDAALKKAMEVASLVQEKEEEESIEEDDEEDGDKPEEFIRYPFDFKPC